jgi:hypothetical protein
VDLEADDAVRCDVCGRPVVEVDGGRDSLFVEITRGDPGRPAEFLDAAFCTQAHAAEWFSRPLPAPSPPRVHVPGGWQGVERLYAVVFVFCAFWAVGLMALGSYALVRLVAEWD